jgi:alpha-galactosidase
MTKVFICCFLLTLFGFAAMAVSGQKFEGLALTPPMGWNSWNTFQFSLNDSLIRETCDAMVANGMRDAGYRYIILDDGWMERQRDSAGDLVADRKRFPYGIKRLAEYVHSRRMKLGIYNCAGTETCGGYPGSRGHEYRDALLYASWDVDYLKLDWCNTSGINAVEAYTTMSRAIRAAGRPMIFSICEWGTNKPWEWGGAVAQLWRTAQDIYNCFDCRLDHTTWYWAGPMKILDLQGGLRKYAGPGHWNDPDMLEVGKGMTPGENRAHFAMWCMLAAPLIAGNDVRSMDASTASLLTDREAIAVDQDSLGIEGFRLWSHDSLEVWCRPLAHDRWAVCFLNRSPVPRTVDFAWKDQPIADTLTDRYLAVYERSYSLFDILGHRRVGDTKVPFHAVVPAHDVIWLRLEAEEGIRRSNLR